MDPLPVRPIPAQAFAGFRAAHVERLQVRLDERIAARPEQGLDRAPEAFLAQDRFTVHIPPLPLCTDNAAMVASAGYYRFALGHRDGLGFDAMPNWPLSSLGA